MTFDKKFGFDPEQMMAMFKENGFADAFSDLKMPQVNAETLMETQRKNLEALTSANRAAAAGYQELFHKQVVIFEETLAAAKKQIAELDLQTDADAVKAKADIAKSAFETALLNMKDLAETAHKANTDALEIISDRVKSSIDDLKQMTPDKD